MGARGHNPRGRASSRRASPWWAPLAAGGIGILGAPGAYWLLTIVLAFFFGSCRSASDTPERILIERPAEARRSVDPAFLPAFDALQAAVADGEDALARRILDGILARRPPAHLLEFARGYERILDGRAVVRSVDLRLASEPVDGSRDFRLVLLGRHSRAEDVVLHLPPSTLRHTVVGVDPAGNESRRLATETTHALSRLVLPAGEPVRLPLLDYELALGAALAVRERWTLELHSGEVQVGERWLPAQNPPVEAVERTRNAPFLPLAPVEPAELVRYVGARSVFLPPLLERAVRIAPERREEALDLLTPHVIELAERDPERVEMISPALRWLARTGRPGNLPVAWAAWFESRRDGVPESGPGGRLDLPDQRLAE
ncbi:MAG: hypothetical protein AAF682_03625 [Planctomycetota bacterium]